MKSKNFQYIEKIDHLRFFAALLVFAYHYWQIFLGGPHTPSFIRESYSGVALFFVLSGFLFMKIALASDTIRYSGFIFNRIVRILPLYLALALLVGTVINHGTLNVFDVVTLPLMVFGSSLLSKSPLTGAAWTIGVEFSFYLLFPFLAQATIRRGWLFLAQLILFIVLLRTVLFLHHSGASNPFYASLVGRFDQFLIGMLAAYGLNHSQALRRIFGSIFTYGASWLLLYLLLFFQARLASIALAQLPNPALAIFWPVLEGLVFAMMIASYTTTKWTPPHIAANSMKYLGKISYSFYLLRVPADRDHGFQAIVITHSRAS